MAVPPSNTPGPSAPLPGARISLALLLAINLFNYIDRQILSAVLPKIELDAAIFDPADPWLKTKLGLLTTAFLLSYMVFSPVFGLLGDRVSRWALVGLGVIVWSLASGGSGLAVGFGALLATRCLVGIGEAAYGPVAPAMLSDLYPERKRGKVMAWFYMAIPVGSALGFVLGGAVAGIEGWGWRSAFKVVVIPGIVLGLLCFWMRDRRGPRTSEVRPSWRRVLGELRSIRSFVLCCAGMTCSTFVLGGVAAWAPYYIFDREARFVIAAEAVDRLEQTTATDGSPVVPPRIIAELRRLESPNVLTRTDLLGRLEHSPLSEEDRTQYRLQIVEAMTAADSIALGTINFRFGAIVVVSGFVATFFGGWLSDRLRDRFRGAYLLVCGYGMLIAFPLFLAMLIAPFPVAWLFVFGVVFFLFLNTGPANTVLANVTRSEIRATAFAINILIIHLLGDAISPPLIGFVSDATSLTTALWGVSAFVLLSGLLWTWGAKYVDEETRRVSTAEGQTAS